MAALRGEEGRALLKKVFESLDANGDGAVSSKEWGKGLSKNAAVLKKFFGGATLAELGKQFKQLDKDGSDSLTWNEMLSGAGVATAAPAPAPAPAPASAAPAKAYRALVMKLPPTATEADLKALFEPHGTVNSATIMKEPDGTPKGFGFGSMDDAAQGRAAVASLAGATVQGQAVAVSEMKV